MISALSIRRLDGMDVKPRRALSWGSTLLLLACLAPFTQAAVEMMPLAVTKGQCECVVSIANPRDQFYLVVGSLDTTAGRHRVTIRTTTTADPVQMPLDSPSRNAEWSELIRDRNARLDKARQQPPSADYAAIPEPARIRTFHAFVGDQDFQDDASYATIKADLKAVGQHCCVYLDQTHADPKRLQPTIDDIVRTFDGEVWPQARERFGRVCDVDRDGRFTILLSGVLDRLQNGKTSLGAFVRGSDFYRDLRSPFGNRCDMMFLNTDLEPGPHLRTLLAHEFTHAVLFSEHVFGDYLPGPPRQDEESWLNEGLAHLAEDMHHYGWSNLDFRVSAFLSDPERYPLVVADYYRAGLWRTPGIRGACYLFLRWCADQSSADFAMKMTKTNLNGLANLETTMQTPFAELFRRWCLALLLNGSGLDDNSGQARRMEPRRPLGDRFLCGPRYSEMKLSQSEKKIELNGTSVSYVLLHSPVGQRCRIQVTGPDAAALQVSLVRLPTDCGRLNLTCEAHGGDVRLTIKSHGNTVTLTEASWERLVPGGAKDPTATASNWFSRTHLNDGDESVSRSLRVDGARPIVFKVGGVDQQGRRIAAWTILSE
jgi:hypothetical protein